MSTERQVRSVYRAMRVLEVLSEAGEPVSLSVLSNVLEMPKSTAHYILGTLCELGFVEKTQRGHFRLGLSAYRVGSAYLRQQSVVSAFKQTAKQMVADCREPVQLAVLDGTQIVYISKVEEGAAPVRLVSEVGTRLPAHTTALGKVLLAYLSNEQFDALFPPGSALSRMTDRSITSVSTLRQELQLVREQGYAHDLEETADGLQCFGAPIFGPGGEVMAAMSISVPSSRVDPERKTALISLLKRGAVQVSLSLGCLAETIGDALRLSEGVD